MDFDFCAPFRRVDADEIGHEEHRMRIAHVDRRGGSKRRRFSAFRPRELDPSRVCGVACQRNFVPGEPRRAHVDPITPLAEALAGEHAGLRLHGDGLHVQLPAQAIGDAAHAVAAGPGDRAVVVIDTNIGGGIRAARIAQRHQLVIVEPGRAVNGVNNTHRWGYLLT